MTEVRRRTRFPAMLRAPEITAIRDARASEGTTQKELADEYGVAVRTVYNIVHRRSWRNLD